ncbi:hypothetical protein [Qipengyuania sp. DGS5-3]|uniref:hypothetical protein n=1 Tax=Qipengyuania sp. DGS5-3 TaxID=3349632 RepID=UPI0036D239D3
MQTKKLLSGLSASTIAITMAVTPVMAQDAQQENATDDDQSICEDNAGAATACGVALVGSAYVASQMAESAVEAIGEGRNNMPKKSLRKFEARNGPVPELSAKNTATAKRPTSLRALKARSATRPANIAKTDLGRVIKNGENAQAARAGTKKPSAANRGSARKVTFRDQVTGKPNPTIKAQPKPAVARPANIAKTDLARVIKGGESAQAARASRIAGSAGDLAELERRGNAAKSARQTAGKTAATRSTSNTRKVTFRDQVTGKPNPTIKAQPKPAAVRPANIASSDLGRVVQNGENARAARATRIAGSADELAGLARRGDVARNARNVAKAGQGSQQLGRQILANGGDLGNVLRKGDVAQHARRLAPVNEAQVVRNIAANGGDISKLNKAGRTAQVARGAGGLKAASTTADAAKMARAAKMAKTAKTAGTVAKVGKGGRAILAGTGVGAVAVVAEMAAVEGIKATTGVEVQDPLSTGFQYGAALFDKDVSLADVAAQRRAHHRENFKNLAETLTTEGKVMDNITKYTDSKNPALGKGVRMMDRFDRQRRAFIQEHTGIKTERKMDVVSRYGAGLKNDGLKGVATVAGDRAKHHIDNARALGATSRAAAGNVTGADLRSLRETRNRYVAAAASDKPVAAVARVAGQRAKHHGNNAKKVGSKVACGIGNIFRKKDEDKDCKK